MMDNWETVSVGDVAELLRGVSYKKGDARSSPSPDFLPVLRANNINGVLNFEDLVYVPKDKVSSVQLVREGDIVLAMSSGSKNLVGKSAIARHDFNGGFGAFCGVIRSSDKIDNGFLGHYFQSDFYYSVIRRLSKGSNINNLKRDHLLDLEIPLPPLPEQKRIVAKIEALFAQLDEGVEKLKQAQQQLKTYRQSVLKAAFEGRLTNDDVPEGELPEGWEVKRSDELFEYVTSGSRGWAKYYSDRGSLFIRITNLNFNTLNLDLSPDKIQRVSLESVNEGKRTKVQEGDLLISITGYLGMTAIVPADIEEGYVNQHIALARPNSRFNSQYLGYFISSDTGGLQQFNLVGRGATKAGLTLGDIKNLSVPIPSLEEQVQVVQEIESRLSLTDQLEKSIEQALQQSETLRQSILKKAFEGRLVEMEKEVAND